MSGIDACVLTTIWIYSYLILNKFTNEADKNCAECTIKIGSKWIITNEDVIRFATDEKEEEEEEDDDNNNNDERTNCLVDQCPKFPCLPQLPSLSSWSSSLLLPVLPPSESTLTSPVLRALITALQRPRHCLRWPLLRPHVFPTKPNFCRPYAVTTLKPLLPPHLFLLSTNQVCLKRKGTTKKRKRIQSKETGIPYDVTEQHRWLR